MALLLPLCGCNEFQKTTKKLTNPVGGEVPPRVANLLTIKESEQTAGRSSTGSQAGTIQSTEGTDSANGQGWVRAVSAESTPLQPASPRRAKALTDGDVAATVNGRPIFVAEILDAYQGRLVKIEQQIEQESAKLPPQEAQKRRDELSRFRKELVLRDLPAYIRRELLVQGFTAKMKDDQRKQLNQSLDNDFDRYLQRMLPEYGVSTRAEFVVELQKRGESFETFKTNYRNQVMAHHYVHMKTGDAAKKEPTRQELLTYYREHIDDYSFLAQVKWQQILIRFDKHDGPEGARQVLSQVIAELREGTDFGDVARKFSDGPNAGQGGEWEWTREGSIADKSVEKSLFELAAGKISRPIENNKSIQLVKVLDRKAAGKTPFEQVQVEIQRKLQEAELKAAEQKVFAELGENAVIHTMFDRDGG